MPAAARLLVEPTMPDEFWARCRWGIRWPSESDFGGGADIPHLKSWIISNAQQLGGHGPKKGPKCLRRIRDWAYKNPRFCYMAMVDKLLRNELLNSGLQKDNCCDWTKRIQFRWDMPRSIRLDIALMLMDMCLNLLSLVLVRVCENQNGIAGKVRESRVWTANQSSKSILQSPAWEGDSRPHSQIRRLLCDRKVCRRAFHWSGWPIT